MRKFVLAVCLVVPAVRAGLPDSTAALLKRHAGFTDEQLATVARGERVVRMIDTGAQDEVAFAGVARLPVKLSVYLQRARAGTLYRVRDPILQVGRFAETPAIEDLRRLRFESYDLTASAQQNKEALLASVRQYERDGVTLFGPLGETPKPVSGFDELAARAGYLRERMPSAFHHMVRYPKVPGLGTNDFFLWKQITFGFRPVTRVAQVSVWEDNFEGRREAIVLMKQIYANRYFEASYQIDHLVADGDGVYLITLNYGRSAWLEGLSGKLIRPIVVARTKAAAEKTIDQAREDFRQESL